MACSYSHPAIKHDTDNWRDLPPEKQVLTSHRSITLSGIPLATNGVLVLVKLHPDRFTIWHITNLTAPTPSPSFAPRKPSRPSRPRKPSFASISDWL